MASKVFDIILSAKDKMSGTIRSAGNSLDKFTNKIQEANRKMKSMNSLGKDFAQGMVKVGDKIAAVGRTMTAAITLPVVAGLGVATKSFIDFEDELLSVQETTGFSGDALKYFGQNILNLSKTLPITANELLKISTEAGRIIELRDPVALQRFTETIAKFTKVSGMAGDQAVNSLSKILKLAGEPIDDVNKLASAMVSLADNFNTTESKITETTFALSKVLSSRFGVASKDVVALSAVMGNLGIDAGRGSAQILKSFDKLGASIRAGKGDELNELVRVTGMDLKELKTRFDKDAFGVFKQLLAGLGRAKAGGEDLGKIFEKLKLGQGKTSAELSKLVDGYWDLVKAQDIAQTQFKTATALQDEYNVKAKSLGNRLEVIKNKFKAFGVELGMRLAPIIEQKVIPAFEKMFKWIEKNPELTDTILKFGLLAAAIGPVLIAVGSLISSIGSLALSFIAVKTFLATFGLTIGVAAIAMAKFIAVAALVAGAAYLIYKNWQPIKTLFLNFWDGPFARWMTGRMIIDAIIERAPQIKAAWQSVKAFFISLWDSPIGKLLRFTASLNPLIALASKITASWEPLKKLMVSIWDDAKAALSSFLSYALTGLGELADKMFFGDKFKFFSAPSGGSQSSPQVFGWGQNKQASMSTSNLGPDRQFAMNNVQSKVETNNAHVVVDFKNMPKGTAVTPTKNEGAMDINLGYASA